MSERAPTEDDVFRATVLFSYASQTTTDRTDQLIFKTTIDLLTNALLEKREMPSFILDIITEKYGNLCDVFNSKRAT